MPVRLWLGAVLVTVGVLWLLDAFEVLAAGDVLARWWPVAVMAFAVVGALTQRRVSLSILVVFVVGSLLLVNQLELVAVGAFVWPVVALVVGAGLLASLFRRRATPSVTGRDTTFAMFGGSEVTNSDAHFTHADVAAVMGGATLDLRGAHLEPGARVDATALFGGVEVIVPETWRVNLSGFPVFGANSDKTAHPQPLAPDAPVIDVRATAIFGGVEVKNTPG